MTESEKEGKNLGRSGCSWENIKLDIKKMGWKFANWIHLAQERGRDVL